MKILTLLSSWKTAPGIGISDYHQFQTTTGSLPIYNLPITCINQDVFPDENLISTFHTCIISTNQIIMCITHLLCKNKSWYDIIYDRSFSSLSHHRSFGRWSDGATMRSRWRNSATMMILHRPRLRWCSGLTLRPNRIRIDEF